MADVYLSFSGRVFDLSYNCSGAIKCKHCLCEIMPPESDDGCSFENHGNCFSQGSQISALEQVKRKLAEEVKSKKEGLGYD